MQEYKIHLICGSTGAGKTTYARKLAERISGIRFSIDEWMTSLYWMDSPQPIDPVWSMERVERCYRQIWNTADQVAMCGVPCVLDLGFTDAKSRERFANLASGAGLAVRLHFVDVPVEERWRRVQLRNAGMGEAQLTFEVTREMFDFVETLWQPPSDGEMSKYYGIRVTGDQ